MDPSESCEDLWECEVAVEMDDMAESMDEVRGKDRASGRIVMLVKFEEFDEGGDGGGELVSAWVCGMGEDRFRS